MKKIGIMEKILINFYYIMYIIEICTETLYKKFYICRKEFVQVFIYIYVKLNIIIQLSYVYFLRDSLWYLFSRMHMLSQSYYNTYTIFYISSFIISYPMRDIDYWLAFSLKRFLAHLCIARCHVSDIYSYSNICVRRRVRKNDRNKSEILVKRAINDFYHDVMHLNWYSIENLRGHLWQRSAKGSS